MATSCIGHILTTQPSHTMATPWPYADINADDPVEDHKNRKIYFYRQYMTDLTERNTKIGAVYPGFKGTVRL